MNYKSCRIEDLNLNILSQQEKTRFEGFKSEKRKLEFYFTRFLWSRFSEYQEIKYDLNGRPKIENGFISISHSRKLIAIAYSPDKHIGIDIEHFNDKIARILPKFLSKAENQRFDLADQTTITTLWSIKEAMYKVLNVKGLIFKEHLNITSLGELNMVELIYDGKTQEYPFKRLIYPDFILTYCTKDILVD